MSKRQINHLYLIELHSIQVQKMSFFERLKCLFRYDITLYITFVDDKLERIEILKCKRYTLNLETMEAKLE